MQLRIVVPNGGEIPKWYGLAWPIPHGNYGYATVAFPVPLNVILNGLRAAYLCFKVGRFRKRQALTQEIELLRAQLKVAQDRLPLYEVGFVGQFLAEHPDKPSRR